MEKLNIYQKMLAISNELEAVNKSFMVEVSKGRGYKAVSEADILSAVKPLEEKYGIYSYPQSRTIIESKNQSVVDGEKTKLIYFERIETTYVFVNVENPTETISMVSYGDGIDSGDKGVGKAMTYADKYALMKAYKIITGEDPDKEASKSYQEKKEPKEETKFATEKQLELVHNLMVEKHIPRELVKMQCGYFPDKKMPLKVCQDIITWLKEYDCPEEDVPF